MNFDLISLLVILVLATVYVLVTGDSPTRQKAAAIGGCAFLLWALLRVFAFLLGKGGV